MAVINGARTVEDVIRTVQSGFMAIMRVRAPLLFRNKNISLIFPYFINHLPPYTQQSPLPSNLIEYHR